MDLSKHLYKAMEALPVIALKTIIDSKDIHWDPPTFPVSLVPDIITGSSPHDPKSVFLISHGSAQNASQVKSWRDLHEFFLYKKQFASIKICRIIYGKTNSKGWFKAMDSFIDLTIYTDELANGPQVMKFLSHLTSALYCSLDKVDVLDHLISLSKIPPLSTFLTDLKKILGGFLSSSIDTTSLISDINFPKGKIEAPFFPTALRRGVVFSGIFPETIGVTLGKTIEKKLIESDLITPTFLGFRWASPMAHWFEESIEIMGKKRFSHIVKRAAPHLRRVRIRWKNMGYYFNTVSQCFKVLERSPNNTSILANFITKHNFPKRGGNSLLLGLRYLLKIGHPDGFGHAKLLSRAGMKTDTAALYKMSRLFNGETTHIDPSLLKILILLVNDAGKLLKTTNSQILIKKSFPVLFFDEAVKLRKVEPLLWLLQDTFPKESTLVSRFPTAVDPSGRVGTIRVLIQNNNLYHWKTAHKGHRDKTKELSAKATAVRILHPHLEKLVLILDGDWSSNDLKILSSSGWTHVYPLSSLSFPLNL